MNVHTGRQVKIGVGVETTRGEGVVSDLLSMVELTNESFNDRFKLVEDNGSVGSITSTSDTFKTEAYSDGSIEFNAKINYISAFLLNVLGEKTTTTLSAGVYKHAFSLLESNSHPSLIVSKQSPVEEKIYKLAMVKSFEITATIGEILKVKVELESKEGEVNNTITKTFAADHTLLSRFGFLKFATNYAGLNAASNIDLRSFKLMFTMNTEKRGSIDSISPVEIFNKTFDVSGTIEFDYADTSMKVLATGATKKAMEFGIVDTENELSTGVHPTLDFKFYRVGFTSWDTSGGNDEIITQSLNFKALYDFGNKATMTCDLINTLDF